MDRPKRKCKPVDRYSPKVQLTKKKPRKRRAVTVPPVIRPKPTVVHIRFWHKIKYKSKKLKKLEGKVFGNDDLWRFIKTFIFYDFQSFCVNGVLPLCDGGGTAQTIFLCRLGGKCPNSATIKCIHFHKFKIYRQGRLRNSKLPTYTHECRQCFNYDPDIMPNMCTIN